MGYSIAILPGDGIGPEVTAVAQKILEAAAKRAGIAIEVVPGLIGGHAIDETGDPFPEATQALVRHADATLLGAVGGPKWADQEKSPESGLLRLRSFLGLFANVRPFEVLPGLEGMSPLKQSFQGGVIIRELLGGLYYGTPRELKDTEAMDTSRYTVTEIERVARLGFELARARAVPLVSVDKANVLATSRLWRRTMTELGRRAYPDVTLLHRYVDAAAMEMVVAPDRFGVVVTENLFGDILSDLSGGLVGSLGVLGSATVRGWSQGVGLYEPIHGSAPDIAGQGVANPIGAIWSVALLFEWSLGARKTADWVRQAVRKAVAAGARTPDIGGRWNTNAVGDAVLREMARQ